MRVEECLRGPQAKENEIILAYVLDVSFGTLRAMPSIELTPAQETAFCRIRGRRDSGMPLQYAIGKWSFYGRDFLVDERALIPRPETELLVEKALDFLKTFDSQHGTVDILDIGTGTGIIALTLALELQNEQGTILSTTDISPESDSASTESVVQQRFAISATDISQQALRLAMENAARFGVKDVKWFKGDLFDVSSIGLSPKEELPSKNDLVFKDKLPSKNELTSKEELPSKDELTLKRELGKFDLIVSNPPYVEEGARTDLQAELTYEPEGALFAGPTGMDVYDRLIPEACTHLKDGGALLLEIGASQGAEVAEKMRQMGYKKVAVHKDLTGRDRIAIGIWNKKYTGENYV